MKQWSLILTVLTACLLNCTLASAIPLRARGRTLPSPGRVTLPLKRFQTTRTNVHPQLVGRCIGSSACMLDSLHPKQLMQQYINRGSKRLSRMIGRQEPPEHELRSAIHKRLYLLGSGQGTSFKIGNTRVGMAASYGRHGSHGITSNGTIANGTMLGGSGATSGNNTGVSPLDIQAATNGGLTLAKPPTTNGSLGLDIE